ncbi:bola-like protein [Rhizophagus irregularis]|uniref:Bola-like protein n=1 Tax=Rhizophagus irregularis TaxID=588596 RepID=A0A2I1GK28_9GLOM|nr:bola-like protein [Rhizophagus irregularis]
MTEVGPIYQSIQQKLTKAFNPTSLEIINESHLHAHHQAMKDVTSKETHFCISIVSDHFEGKKLIQRHRLIYELLNEEMNTSVHALSIKAKTSKEVSESN